MTTEKPATPCCEVTSCGGTDMKNWTGLEKAAFITFQGVGYIIISPFAIASAVIYVGVAMPVLGICKFCSGDWN